MNTISSARSTVCVADPLHDAGLQALRAWARVVYTPERQALDAALDAQGLVVRAPVSEAVLDLMPNLRMIVRCGAGIDGIPTAYAAQRGIVVANTPGANAEAVAEYVFASVLQVARDISGYADALRDGQWQQRGEARERSFELRGRRLGVLGMGAIGQRVAAIGQGFGMAVQATVTTARPLPDCVSSVDIETLFKTSDVLVLCASLTDATRGLVGEAHLLSMPARAVLVNVGRGALIDEAALLSFAANPQRNVALVLDVHHHSPLAAEHPLTHAHLCWPTPHLAGITADAERRMALATNQALAELLAPPAMPAD